MFKMVCTKNELQILSRLPWDKKKELFLQLWVKKEAFLKAMGVGLHGDISNIDVSGTGHNFLGEEDGRKIDFYEIDVKYHICYVAYNAKISTNCINIYNIVKLF